VIVFRIDKRSGVSTYMQLIQQVKGALRLGILGVGDQLPTAKDVVASTAINPNTVLKAYRELEREGLVEPRPGMGTFIRRSLAHPEATVDSPLGRELAAWMHTAKAADLSRDDVEALVKAVLDDTF
jgi:GntR family transcriptional regulator